MLVKLDQRKVLSWFCQELEEVRVVLIREGVWGGMDKGVFQQERLRDGSTSFYRTAMAE